jgi:phage repressor protein C with HTH and peptisase S24 domain
VNNYSDLSLRQLYDLLYQSLSDNTNGKANKQVLSQLREEADRRDKNLYDNISQLLHSPPTIANSKQVAMGQATKQIIAIQNVLRSIDYDIAKVSGESMINCNIKEGDYVLFDTKAKAVDGDIIIAEYKNQKFIKIYASKDGNIVLQSSNPDFPDIPIKTEAEFRLLGVVQMVLNEI